MSITSRPWKPWQERLLIIASNPVTAPERLTRMFEACEDDRPFSEFTVTLFMRLAGNPNAPVATIHTMIEKFRADWNRAVISGILDSFLNNPLLSLLILEGSISEWKIDILRDVTDRAQETKHHLYKVLHSHLESMIPRRDGEFFDLWYS